MEYTAENLEKVVTLFYRSEAGQQAQAHQWLTEAQNSPQAWSFVWELLQPHRSSEVQFFAATTLHTKLLKHWNEVPSDHYEQLKKKIVENIINYAMGPKIVLNRLCIALSAYIIHTIPAHWPNAFEELVSSFQPQNLPNINSDRVVWILLEILTVIPEEFQSTTLPINQKTRVRLVLQEVSQDILKVLEMCLVPAINNDNWSTSGMTTCVEAARCAGAWLQFGGINISTCSGLAGSLIQVTCRAYWHAQTDELEDTIDSNDLELLEACSDALTHLMSHPQTHKYPQVVLETLRRMLQHLLPILSAELRRPLRAQNKDVVCVICGLLVATADSHSKLLVGTLSNGREDDKQLALGVIRSVLQCSAAPGRYPVDESASTLAFGFWYTLQDDALALDTAACARVLLLLKPLYRELVTALLYKSSYPLDNELQRFSADDKELFRCYRQDIADTLMYCHSVLNIELLDLLNTKLNESIDACRDSENRVNLDIWPEIESCLHAYYAIAEAVDVEDVYLPRLMQRLKDIPYEQLNVKVLGMALDTFGAYAEWITEHPDTLASAIPFLTAGLAVLEVSASATMALKDLTHNCQRFLQPYAPHILAAAHGALAQGHLRLAECVRLMFSIGKVLSIISVPQAMEYLNLVLTPQLEELQALVAAPNAQVRQVVTRLKMVSALFCSLHTEMISDDVEQPVLVVVRCTWSLWRGVAARWVHEPEVMDVLCGVLKHVVSTLGESSAPLTGDMLALLGQAYQAQPQPAVLYAARPLLLLWGHAAAPLLRDLISVTLAVCASASSTTPTTLADQCDVLDAFFQTLAQVTKKNPTLLLEEGIDSTAIFQCASMCITMSELQVLKSCASFLTNFIAQSRELQVSNVVTSCGEQLVCRILLNLGGAAPRSAVEPMAELLLALNKKYCDSLARWLNRFLGQDDQFPSSKISREQKELFIKTVLREKANKRKLTESVLEFTLICRGILKPEVVTS